VQQLNLAEEKLSGVLDSIRNVVWSQSLANQALLYLNPAAELLFGRPVADFFADGSLLLRAVHADDRQRVNECMAEIHAGKGMTLEYRIVQPDGAVRWVENKARLITGPDGRLLSIDGVASDIALRRSQAERMEYQANHDALTGLPNRSRLNDRIDQALARAGRTGQHVAVLFMDLDGFKFVNDSYGHSFGDKPLCAVASRLSVIVRDCDTVARQGGDEFVILLPDLGRAEDALQVAAEVLDAFTVALPLDGRDLHISASIGVSTHPRDGDDSDSLLKHADVAMYRAKAHGRIAVQACSQEMGAQALERMELEAALRFALERNELALHYQPQVDRSGTRIVGLEALIRWHHPQLGMVSPLRFIPLAEETGLIMPIGDWVLRTACAQASAWHAAGFSGFGVAVNLSARQFQQQDIPALVREVLAQNTLSAACLELELTECALMQNTDATVETMRQLKRLGVRLALDGFGTGYSSLSYLTRFPIDVLKIDKSFVADVPHDEGASSITRAIIAMAQSPNMDTVAEGVETAEQHQFLSALHCGTMQGYHVSRPLPVDQVTALLRDGLPQRAAA